MSLDILLYTFRSATAVLAFTAVAATTPSIDLPGTKTLSLTSVLARLSESAAMSDTPLPNFRCNEAVISEELAHDTIRKRLDFTADLRLKRDPGGSFMEFVGVLTADGKPVNDTQDVDPPVYVEGVFTNALYNFIPEHLSCYSFALSPGRLDFTALPDIAKHPGCFDERGLHGFATLNEAGEITHLERHLPEKTAARLGVPGYSEVDFAPVEIAGHTYRLAAHAVSNRPVGRETQHFEATYTNCRLFPAKPSPIPPAKP